MSESSNKSRLRLIVRAIEVIQFLSTPGWHTYREMAAYLEVDNKTARRWLRALEEGGHCIELQSPDGEIGPHANKFRLSMTERGLRATDRLRMATRPL